MLYYFSLLTLFLCIVLFTFNLRVNKTILYLIGFLVPLSIYGIFHYLVFYNDSAFKLALINVQSIPIYYLAPPMLFFYVRSTLNDSNVLGKKDFIHFLPSLIGLISVLPFIFKSFDYKLAIAQQFIDDPNSIKSVHTHWFYPNYVNVIARPTQLFIYSIVCLVTIFRYSTIKRVYSPTVQKDVLMKWLITISILALLMSLSYILMTYQFLTSDNIKKEAINQLLISFVSGFLFVIIPIMVIVFPDILYGIPRVSNINLKEEESTQEQEVIINEYGSERIAEDPFSDTAVQILNYMEQDKPYLKPKFGIDDVINDLDIPKHHVYYCFNNIIQTKFTVLRTNYRIAHAKNLLLSDKVDTMTIEGIGLESGFASKSTFFAVFKQSTGLSPLDFMQKYRKD